MKFVKGCLLYFALFILIMISGGYFLYKKMQNNCLKDYEQVESSYKVLQSKLFERNKYIKTQSISDSLNNLITKSDSILRISKNTNDYIWLEFDINAKSQDITGIESFNRALNNATENFNFNLRSFNNEWKIMPKNFINYRLKLYSYRFFEINYGQDNALNKERRRKAEHFIETGEFL